MQCYLSRLFRYCHSLSNFRALAAGVVLALLSACAAEPVLQPLNGFANGDAPDRLYVNVRDVGVEVETQAWHGHQDIREYVIPVRVRIDNDTDTPVRVRYEDIVMRGSDGAATALPPFAVDGEVAVRGEPIVRPRYLHYRYRVADHHLGYYPTLFVGTGVGGVRVYDAYDLYQTNYGFWKVKALPTPQMLEHAIPEGVLEPGGSLSGFIYFDADVFRMAQAGERLSLRMTLVPVELDGTLPESGSGPTSQPFTARFDYIVAAS